jgi:phosphoribosylamine--glycine ligase
MYTYDSTIGEQILMPLEKSLVEMGHLGDIDINCIVDDKGKVWPLECTCRDGFPAFNIMLNEHRNDPCQWMLDACNGKDTLEVSNEVAVGIVIAMPDYPYSNFKQEETTGIPIYGVSAKNQRYIQPQSVMISRMPDMDGEKVVEKDIWVTAGDYIAVVTGLGKTVSQACERAYATIKEIHVPDMIFRDDVGEKLKEEIPKLQKFNYAREFTY